MTYACHSCYSSSAEIVTLRVGELLNKPQTVRMQFCGRCRIGVWNPWLHIKALDGVSL